jgi:hypothetical protein
LSVRAAGAETGGGLPAVKPATLWKLSPYESLALGPDP